MNYKMEVWGVAQRRGC